MIPGDQLLKNSGRLLGKEGVFFGGYHGEEFLYLVTMVFGKSHPMNGFSLFDYVFALGFRSVVG